MAKKKKTQDTSPLALGRQQRGSAANERAKKTESKPASQSSSSSKSNKQAASSAVERTKGGTFTGGTGSYSSSRSSGSSSGSRSVTQKDRQNQKSYGTTTPETTTARNATKRRTTTGSTTPKTAQEMQNQRRSGLAAEISRRNNPLGINKANKVENRYSKSNTKTAATAKEMMAQREQEREARANRSETFLNEKQRQKEIAKTRQRNTLDKVDNALKGVADREARWERNTLASRNTNIKAKQDEAHRKTGEKAADRFSEKFEKQKLSQSEKNLLDYTEGVVKRKALGYAKTASDALKQNEGYQASGRWAQEDPEYARRITSKDFATRADKAFNEYAKKQDDVQKKLTGIENNASGAGRITLQAYGSGIEMGIDRLAGPLWAASMFASAYGNQRGQALKEGATDEQDARAAFFGAGLEVATEYMFKPVAGIASKFGGKHSLDFAGKLAAKVTGKLTGRKKSLADIAIRTIGSQAEEGAEELVGWAASPYINNAVYKNDLQQKRTEDAHASYKDMNQTFWSQFDSEEEAQAAALHVNSQEFVDDLTKTYKDSGATDEEAAKMASLMQQYFLAHFDNDEEAADKIEEEMDKFVVGDVREKHSPSELRDTLLSTFLLTGVTGGASVYYTNQVGNQMLNEPGGKDKVKAYTDLVIKYDPDNAKEARTIKSTIDDGGTPTGTQAYLVSTQAMEVLNDMAKSEAASNQVKQRGMRDEDLRVSPLVQTPNGARLNEQTAKAYQASYEKTTGIIRGLRKHGIDTGLSDETLTDKDTMRNAAHIVAAYETGTITADQINNLTVDNPEMRTIFSLATGVDLNQYNVTSKGKLNETATNRAMLNGLLALSAQNYIESARIEQEAWNDQTRGQIAHALGRRFDPQGDIAVHDALNSVDPRDQAKFMLMTRVAQDVYRYSYNTQDDWQDIKRTYQKMYPSLNVDALEGMYESAKEDKAEAETPYLNYEVKVGEALDSISKGDVKPQIRGKFVNETSYNPETGEGRALPESDRIVYASLAKGINANITMIDAQDERLAYTDENGDTQYNNASVDLATGEILLSNALDVGTAVHEVTHVGARLASRYYRDLADYIFDKAYKYDPEKTMRILDAYRRVYADQNLSDAKLKEEVVSDLVASFQNDPRFMRDISQDNPSLARKIINAITDILRSLRNILATGRIQDPAVQNAFLVEIGAYEEARRMWLEMYREAQKNNAALGIAKWHENAISDNRIANARHTNVEQAEKERELFLRDSEGNGLTDRQAQILHDIGPDIRFSRPTFLNALAKGKYYANMNNGKGGFAGLSEIASGKDILKRTMQENGFSEDQTDAVVGFLSHMADYLDSDELQMQYSFIGWQDLSDAEITVRRDKDDNIIGVAVSAMVVNGEYPVNFDMTTICNKREGVMEVIQELTRKYDADTGKTILNSVKLTDEKMWSINEALKAEGIDTACLGCFVEARRYYTNRFIDKIDDVWNSAVRDARKQLGLPEEEYFNFAKGKKVSGEDYNKISDLWTAYDESDESKRSPSQRIKILMDEIVRNKEVDSPYLKLISAEDILTPEGISGFKKISTKDRDMVKMIKSIYGTSAPKEILAFTPYNSEIALLPDKIKGVETGEYLKSIGGTRVQSFSDFKMAHMFDHMQMVADEAARGFVNHGYSKVIAYPKLFGLTGRKINMSVMFDVLPASEWQSVLGCSEETAKEIADKYQGLRFVKEKPAENPDNRPYVETEIEGVHGYLTYLVSDADYVNSVFDELYQQYLAEGMDEDTARREANKAKPFEQSINYREAVDLENQDGYKENVGIIAVAYGNEHLRMLLDDPNVRYIIPYHRSGLPVFIAQKTALDIAKDYTDFQNTRKAKGGLWSDKDGNKVRLKNKYAKWKEDHADEAFPAIAFFRDEIGDYTFEPGKLTTKEKASLAGTGTFDVYENLDKVSDIKEISNAYLEHCINNNQVPIFHEFAGHPNYYKMLFDFAVTDAEGNIYPQRPVRNVYPGLDIDAKVAAGEKITEEDYEEFYKAIKEGLATENAKNQLRSERLGKVLDEDLLSREGENSIIADSNIQHIVNGTPDYTDPKGSDVANSRDVSLDDQYMQAVNSGNMEEAQRLVDEAAKSAGFKPVHRYHGTMNAGFTVFDKAYAKVGGNSGAGFYFSTEEDDSVNHYADVEGADNYFKWSELAEQINQQIEDGTWDGPELETYEDVEEYAKEQLNKEPGTFDVYLNYKNPYIRDYGKSTDLFEYIMDGFDESIIDRNDYDSEDDYEDDLLQYKDEYFFDTINKAVYEAYDQIEGFYDYVDLPNAYDLASAISGNYDYNLNWETIENEIYNMSEATLARDEWGGSGDGTRELTRAIIEALGFDAVEDKEVSSKFGQLSREMMTDTEHVIVFKPEQIKLSDPVTYAQDGSVIPLSERFDPNNNDIRYSRPTIDAEGNILTDDQMEYFKNSQARDEQGRLVPVYHTTGAGGFTVFEGRMIFFTDNLDMSRTYADNGETYKVYLNIENPLIIDCGGSLYNEIPYWTAYDSQGGAISNIGSTFEESAVLDIADTNTIASIAKQRGYDGVIFKNIRDNGIYEEQLLEGDVYVAFSSNQVKDVNNKKPTENPDIRYSIPTESEIKDSVMQKAENIEDIPLADPVLEESRIRYAISADDFTRKYVGSWNERDRTFGLRLDEKSVRKHIVALMRHVMAESNTGKQYRADTLEDTMNYAKIMWYEMKAFKTDAFAKTAWKAAEQIVDDIDYNDELYVEYKGVRDYLKKRKIQIPEELMYDESFADFMRDNAGRMRFETEGSSVEAVYKYLRRKYPSLFTEDLDHPVDMLLQIDYALTLTEPYREAYTSEEYTDLVDRIATSLVDIVSEGKAYVSVADELTEKYEAKVKAMKQRHEEALRKVREERDAIAESERERADMWKQRYNERIQKEKQSKAEKRAKADHKKKFAKIEKKYKNLCQWVLDPTKDKNVPEEFRRSLAEFLQTLDLQTENSKALEEQTGHVAQKTFKMRELKDRLKALATSKTDTEGNYTPSLFEVDENVAFILDKLTEKLEKNGNTIDALDENDIDSIDVFMTLLIRNINRYKQVKKETKNAELAEVRDECMDFFEAKIKRDGLYKKREWVLGALDTINATSLTPAYLFDRMGPLKEMYDVLRHNGFDTYIRNEAMIIDKISAILGPYYKGGKKPRPGSVIEDWRNDKMAQTIQLTHGTVTLSVAQMMSLHCLAKRGTQATDHMTCGGIYVTPIQAGSKIQEAKERYITGKVETPERLVLTHDDIETITAKLTDEQVKVADALQQIMSEDMARLGNEAHRELYGYNNFNDPNYFPIKVHGNELSTDINNIGQVVEKIKSYGPAKPVTPGASNALIIDDIFSVVADHCNGMNLYNAYLVPITDFMKVLNSSRVKEDGTEQTMKDLIEQAYGKDMLTYIMNLMKDINGIKADNRGGLEGIMNKALGRAKKTAVFGNLRVALQQPTAIVRAFAEIDPKYIYGVLDSGQEGNLRERRADLREEMYKYCPIAQWKAWGYYDTYMGRDIEDVMMNNWSMRDVALSGLYGELDNWTWSLIWRAVKAEMKAKHPEMDTKSEEFLQLCGRRASEVFDKTQVVDSTFHRSDAMRNKQVAVKVFTAFMAEPTLTLNVFRAGLYNAAEESKAGNKGKARKILSRTISVMVLQAAIVSAAQAFADAWRGKDPGWPWGDDDDNEEEAGYWLRWLHNFVYNLFDQFHLENNMYLIKDVSPYANYIISKAADYWDWNPTLRAIMGWDQDYLYSQNNLVFAGLENTANGVAQLFKKLEKGEDYVDYKTGEPKKMYDIVQKIMSGIGTFIGLPAGTLMRDFRPIIMKLFPAVFASDSLLEQSLIDRFGKKGEDSSEAKDAKSDSTEDLPDSLTDEQKAEIKKAEERRNKKKSKNADVETGQLDHDTMLYNALKAGAGLEGEEYNKKVYSSVSNGLKGYVADGDYASIAKMRDVIEEAGGDVEYFDKRVLEETKRAYKKTFNYDQTIEEYNNMKSQWRYMVAHGMTAEEISSEIIYKSDMAKDMKVAYRVGDESMIVESMQPLLDAGITKTDLEKLYNNRNRVQIKNYDGRWKDKLKSTGTFIWPTQGTITSHFGYRNAPTAGASSNHPAIDIGAPSGSEVVAADGGTVIYVGWNGGYGNSVGIKHDNGMVTYYNHLSGYNVKEGDTVAQGQPIAQVGSTGISTGPHLDFKVLDADGNPVDPEKYLS